MDRQFIFVAPDLIREVRCSEEYARTIADLNPSYIIMKIDDREELVD